jgi:uroporphyrinogen decarboxylase
MINQMNARERVLAVLSHKEPDRVPIDFGSFWGATSMNFRAYQNLLGYLGINREPRVESKILFTAEIDDDILERFNVDTKSLKPSIALDEFNAPEEFIERPWDVKWRRSIDFTYAPVAGPFQEMVNPSLDDLKTFKWPSPSDIEDFAKWGERAYKIRQKTDRALVASMRSITTHAQILRGFEGWALDLILNRVFSDALHEKLAELWIGTADGMLDALGDNVDILFFGDDFAAQNQLLFSPQIFRERIKPLLKQMVGKVKAKTKAKVVLHSCGSVYPLIEDFIDIGIDGLNPLQANAKDMEPNKIKEKAGKDLALWGGIDTHVLLPKGTPKDVREEVKRRIAILGEGGGYVLSADHNILIDVPPENLIAMFEAAIEYGKY